MSSARWRGLYGIADLVFAVEADVRLSDLARALYIGARTDRVRPSISFSLENRADRYILRRNGLEIVAAADLPSFFQEVEWNLTETAMEGLGHFFQVHAGVAVFEDRAHLLIGPPDAGKTSLVLGLAERGATVFTDEVALVEPRHLRVQSFRRDLIVHRETERLFVATLAHLDSPPFKVFPAYRYLDPTGLDGGHGATSAAIAQLVFPVLRLGAAVEVRPVGQAEAARRVLEQVFNLDSWKEQGVDLIGRLVEACGAVEVVFGDARHLGRIYAP